MSKFEIRVKIDHYFKSEIETRDIVDEHGEITDFDKLDYRVWQEFIKEIDRNEVDWKDMEVETWWMNE